jgi:hypothetical protein
VISVFEWLEDLLKIYTWKEFWILVSVPFAIMGVWFLFYLLLCIPVIIIRAIGIWSLIFILTFGAAAVDVVKKQSGKRSS